MGDKVQARRPGELRSLFQGREPVAKGAAPINLRSFSKTLPGAIPMTSTPFSASYAEARARFLETARGAGAAMSSWGHPERGPDGGELATDCA